MVANYPVDTVDIIHTLNERLFSHALNSPSHDAIVTPAFKLSYLELSQLVKSQVNILHEIGVETHSVVGIRCTDEAQHLVLSLATAYLGCTSCTIPTYETDQVRDSVIKNCAATIILDETVAVNLQDRLIGTESKLKPSTSARLLFSTSGTTGNPKLVVHEDEGLVMQAHRHVSSAQERFLCLASIEHNFAKRHRLYCLVMGATNIFLDMNQESLAEQCDDLNVNVMHVSAFQAQELLAVPNINKLSNIRLKLGGSHADASLRQKLRDGITQNLQAGYGTTETGAIAFTDPNDLDAGESVGQALPGIEICTVTPEKKTLKEGEHGEIAIRCSGMFREYLNNSELTNSRLKDEWFYTGDIGFIDDKERIYLCGRSDDMFVFNSINIYPQEIESLIRKHSSVADVAVIPKKSSMHGDIPVALIVFDKNVKAKLPALKKYVKKLLGARTPRQFIIVDQIPRNSAGKIIRNKVKTLSNNSDDVRKFIIDTLGENVTKKFKPSFITELIRGEADIKLNKFELDSLARMDLLVALEVNYEAIISPVELNEFRYFGHLVARVLSIQSKASLANLVSLELAEVAQIDGTNKSQHHIVRLVRRAFNFCPTVTQFNEVLRTLSNRITPLEVKVLHEANNARQVIPINAADKYHAALNVWLRKVWNNMMDFGKLELEPYIFRRVSPHVRYFVGSGSPAEKTLVVCFAGQGGASMMIPSAVLLQHTNSTHYDLLVIAEPLHKEYCDGVPFLGNNVNEVIKYIANLDIVSRYKSIRTFGCSAGGYMAVIAAYKLNAELAVSVGARFHEITQFKKYLERIVRTWYGVFEGNCSRVLMTYIDEDARDRHCAKIISKLTSGNQIIVKYQNEDIGHHMLRRLMTLKELKTFLSRTIYSEMSDKFIKDQKLKVILSLPEDTV